MSGHDYYAVQQFAQRQNKLGHKFIIVATLIYSFMSKETLVFISGILLTIVPFVGVPELWRRYVVLGLGILLILIGYFLRRNLYLNRLDKGNGERGSDTFIETTEVLFDEGALK